MSLLESRVHRLLLAHLHTGLGAYITIIMLRKAIMRLKAQTTLRTVTYHAASCCLVAGQDPQNEAEVCTVLACTVQSGG